MKEITLYQLSLDELSKAVADKILIRINQGTFKNREERQYLTRNEVASLCKVKSLTTLWSWKRQGILIPTSKAGRKPLYLKEDVIKFLENKEGGYNG